MTLHTCNQHLRTYLVKKLKIYMVEQLKTFRVVLKLLEYIVVLHTLLCAGRKLSYNFTNKNKPPAHL